MIYYDINDHLGTPQKVIDQNVNVVWAADYKPFGEVNETIDAFDNLFRFPGQYYDQETVILFNYHRYYNPKSGRYLTPDPIRLEGGINLYSYVQNCPVNLIDPLGLEILALGDYGGAQSMTPTTIGFNERSPDFYSLTLAIGMYHRGNTKEFIGWGIKLDYDHYGNLYFTPLEGEIGWSRWPRAESITAIWIDQCERPKEEELENIISGLSIGVNGGFVLGGGYSSIIDTNNFDIIARVLELGLYTPQINGNDAYTFAPVK